MCPAVNMCGLRSLISAAFLAMLALNSPVLCMNITISTKVGNIVGSNTSISFAGNSFEVTVFYGIPFAEPPTGQRRFKKPVRKAEFTETFYANTMSPMCFQNLDYYNNVAHTNISVDDVNQSEDCLYLNIYMPGDGYIDPTAKRSVMVWIYGGGFQFGAQQLYTGLAFAALNNVILVTLNYRLSVFGFLSSGDGTLAGNYGLWDQHLGIKWVKDNIEFFGANPNNITIFGESAGARSVVYQALYPGNKGLFTRAIAESGTADMQLGERQHARETFVNFITKLNCHKASPSDTADCLRKLSYARFVELTKHNDTFYPAFDADFIPEKPSNIFSNKTTTGWTILKSFGELDFIMGVNSAEGGAMVDVVEQAIRSQNKDPTKGYTLEMFQNIIVPTILPEAKLKHVLTQAIVNQYVDWTSPNDALKMRLRTIDFMSDAMFNADAIRTANAHSRANNGGRLFFYVYDHQFSLYPPGRWYQGANHTEEVELVLGFPSSYRNYSSSNLASRLPNTEVELSKQMMAYWTNFAKSG